MGKAIESLKKQKWSHWSCGTHFEEKPWVELRGYVCTLVNNQHSIKFDLGSTIDSGPFAPVLRTTECKFMFFLIGTDFAIFNRAWCLYEYHIYMEQMLQRRIWIFLTTPEGSVEFGTLSTDTLQNFANKVRDLSL